MAAYSIVSSQVDSRIWKFDRSGYWWQHIIAKETLSENDWLETFRMNRATFDYLCHQLAPMIERQSTQLIIPIPVDQRVAIAIWCLATNVEHRTVGHLFGVSRATVCLVLKDLC